MRGGVSSQFFDGRSAFGRGRGGGGAGWIVSKGDGEIFVLGVG